MSASSNILLASAIAGSILLSSCASIVSRASRDVSIQSNPSGLNFSIINKQGETIHSGTTPQVVNLSARGGYFVPAKYTIEVKRGGKVISSQTVTASLNGWYAGNILFGGIIGLIIVDPLTGAMYRLPETIHLNTSPAPALASAGPRSLELASIETLTAEQRASLVRL
jgi:hypothetical protein